MAWRPVSGPVDIGPAVWGPASEQEAGARFAGRLPVLPPLAPFLLA